MIRLCLTIDTDPDGATGSPAGLRRDARGFESLRRIESLRAAIACAADRLGLPIPVTWFIRCDDQIAAMHGHAAYLLEAFAPLWHEVRAAGDELAWHPHLYDLRTGPPALERDPQRLAAQLERCWQMLRETAAAVSLTGERCWRSFRSGEGYLTPAIVECVERLGLAIDSSVIPGRSDASDWRRAPRHPYHPAPDDPARAGPPRALLEVPVRTWRVQAPYDPQPRVRYVDPAIHPPLFAAALGRTLRDDPPADDAVWVMVLHPDEALPAAKSDALYARDPQAVCENLCTLVRSLRSAGFDVRFDVVGRVGATERRSDEATKEDGARGSVASGLRARRATPPGHALRATRGQPGAAGPHSFPPSHVLTPVEHDLRARYGAAAVFWAGRGAQALLWAYQAARLCRPACEAPEVIIPATCCPSVAHAAVMAGLRVRVADVDPASGLLTAGTARQRLTPQTCALVAVHLFGQTADLTDLRALCDEHDIVLIEDAAQALGAEPRSEGRRTRGEDQRRAADRPDRSHVPTFPRSHARLADCCVLSFSRTKILPAGGGALIVQNPSLADSLRQKSACIAQPESPLPIDRLARAYRDLTHRLAHLHRLGAPLHTAGVYARLARHFDAWMIHNELNAEAIAEQWPTLPSRLDRRRTLAELYARELAGGPWTILDGWRRGGVCWRFTLLVDDPAMQQPLARALRTAGFHASTLYPPLNIYFHEPQPCPAAEAFWRRVINLWVDPSVDEAYVRNCTRTLRQHAYRPTVRSRTERPNDCTVTK